MKRRTFLSSMAAGGMALSASAAPIVALPGQAPDPAPPAEGARSLPISTPSFRMNVDGSLSNIGRWSLAELLRHFQKELAEDTVGFWENYGIDREFGAYLRPDKRDKTYPTTDKDLYSQGRILWLFSTFYNNFGKKKSHLDAARRGKEALVKHCRLGGGHWGTLYTRDWKMKEGLLDIYADVYMILGLQEYHKATGDEEAKTLAVETSYAVNERILAPHYQGAGHGTIYEPGIKRLGTWVHFLYPLTLFLSHTKNEGLERIARFCVRNILVNHWQRDKGFAWECLDHRYEPYSDDYLSLWLPDSDPAHEISGWHSIQGAFKVMLEALRVGSREMFLDGMEFGFQTIRTHWTSRGDGGFQGFGSLGDLKKGIGKMEPDAAIYDYLIFTLIAIEHTLSPEAVEWFEKIFSSVMKRPGGIFNGSLSLHEPRGVMLAVQILSRMIERGGGTSGFFKS
ncbi:MAG TPA: AGE family epimerase/isomerase [Candidatus Aminicenantes bacterium]|nr:AGE family epimerase/isomerase [Candidatus Aminicenantes bacterium]